MRHTLPSRLGTDASRCAALFAKAGAVALLLALLPLPACRAEPAREAAAPHSGSSEAKPSTVAEPGDPMKPAPDPKPTLPDALPTEPAQALAQLSKGPELDDADALLVWLEHQARSDTQARRRFYLPIVADFDGLGVQRAAIGIQPAALEQPALAVRLDDSAMGIGLADRLRSRCPSADAPCAFWVVAYWGPLLEGPSFEPANTNTLAVLELVEHLPDGIAPDASAAYLLAE